jgi:hypothetical protein
MMCENCRVRPAHYADEYCGYDCLCEGCQDKEMLSHAAGRTEKERAELKEARRFS